MPVDIYNHKGINSMLYSSSNGNVVGITAHNAPSGGLVYRMVCSNCKGSYDWVPQDFNKSFGVGLEILYTWCEQHRHTETFQHLVSCTAPIETPIGGMGCSCTMKTNPTPVVFINNYTSGMTYPSFDYMYNPAAEMEVTYKSSSLQLDQMVMKKVWQWSGFNVDLQANDNNGLVNKFRALCKCGVSIPLVPHKVISNDPLTWDGIKTFCEDHRFCGTGVQNHKRPTGRKFKNG